MKTIPISTFAGWSVLLKRRLQLKRAPLLSLLYDVWHLSNFVFTIMFPFTIHLIGLVVKINKTEDKLSAWAFIVSQLAGLLDTALVSASTPFRYEIMVWENRSLGLSIFIEMPWHSCRTHSLYNLANESLYVPLSKFYICEEWKEIWCMSQSRSDSC